jgi:TonB-linked SusC/RagA family outer membrane protein
VAIPGARLAVTTDLEGRYTLTGVPPGTYRLEARLIGYAVAQAANVVVTAGQTTTTDFQLERLAIALTEVVVVGYGTQVRRDVTGSVTSVAGPDVQRTVTGNAIDAIKGRVAGVDIVSERHMPGSGVRVRIRGERSLEASNDPLYVLDGIPLSGGIGDVNPNDIESIEVLKDASATAIYGSRGANGVVLITTRQGKAGVTSITYDTYAGVQREVRRLRMMNGPEWAEHRREAYRAAGTYPCDPPEQVCAAGDTAIFGGLGPDVLDALREGRWTDWQDLVLRPAMQTSHQVGITGGDEKTRFALSINQLDQDGIVRGQDFLRRSLRLNFDHRPSTRFRVGSSVSLIRSDQNLSRGDGNYSEALSNVPLGMPYDSLGNILFKPTTDGQRVNPLSDIQNHVDERGRTRVFGTLFTELDLAEGLTWRVNFGPDLTFWRRGQFRGAETQAKQGSGADAGLWEERTLAYTLDNILTYRKSLGADHRLDATFLYSMQQEREERDSSYVQGLPYEQQLFYDLGSALVVERVGSLLREWALESYMVRLNYALKDRYLLTLTSRLDGSSRLAPGQKYALFPSVAVGWRLSEEPFLQRSSLFSDLKLRASYGQTGNTSIDPYQTQGSLARVIYAFGDLPAVGYRPATLPNPDLKWERTSQVDVGLEFTFGNGRISGSVDYYRAHTRDLLMERQLPPTSGYGFIIQNIGSTRNTGLEVALSATLVDRPGFRWSTDLAWATNKNSIVSLFGGRRDDIGNRWFIGYPIDVHYDYDFDGIWQLEDSLLARRYGQEPGEIRVRDVNRDSVISDQDRVILGAPFPDWSGSLTSRLDWKGFDLTAMVVARWGFMARDEFRTDFNQLFGRYNNLNVNYWTPTNPSNTDPRPQADQESPLYGGTRAYGDGSFVRVRNLTLGYTVPAPRLGGIRARSLRVYATAQDPFLFTRYRGLDPESHEDARVPSPRTLLMGLSVGF